jgi:hypothetical protein
MYFQLVKKFIRWEKCQKKNDWGISQKRTKKDVWHYAIVL